MAFKKYCNKCNDYKGFHKHIEKMYIGKYCGHKHYDKYGCAYNINKLIENGEPSNFIEEKVMTSTKEELEEELKKVGEEIKL